jgi:hypothetical protein
MKDKIYVTEKHVIANTPVKELTTYPTVNTIDELKQQVDVLVASGRGSYSVGITLTVDDNSKTTYVNELPTV